MDRMFALKSSPLEEFLQVGTKLKKKSKNEGLRFFPLVAGRTLHFR